MRHIDPAALRASAERAYRSAGWLPFLYAAVLFFVGMPLGVGAVVSLNGMIRLNQIRSREDISELVHSEDKREELRSLFWRAPGGAVFFGVVLAGIGAIAGLKKRSRRRLAADTALALAELHERLVRQ